MSKCSLTLSTSDAVSLEAELATPAQAPRATAVLCHPHPQYGGTMRSIVIGALFDALPTMGVTTLRFNFRGVEGSTGTHDDGRSELLDVRAAVDAAADEHAGDGPLLLAGWSFGADMTLSTHDVRLAGWLAIAPALRFAADFAAVAADARPKQFVLGQRDEVRDPAWVIEETADWVATAVEVIAGASHFFVGRTDRVVDAARSFVERLLTG